MTSFLDKYREVKPESIDKPKSLLDQYREPIQETEEEIPSQSHRIGKNTQATSPENQYIPEVLKFKPSKEKDVYDQYKQPLNIAEDLEKMEPEQKRQYSQDLKTEREYLQSAGFTKGALSGLTLGATEHIDALKPDDREHLAGFGEAVGAAVPIAGIAKALSLPIKYGLSGLSKTPAVLNVVSKLMTAFGTGSTYETGKQAVKGEGFDPQTIALRGAEFATVDALFQGGSALLKKLGQFTPKQRAQILEKGVVPEDLPKSQFETAQGVIEELKTMKKQPRLTAELPNTSGKGQIEGKRITQGKDIGLRPAPISTEPKLNEEVGNLFSDKKFYNTTEGGQALKNEIMSLDQDVYRGVGEMYNISRELNKEINEIHPNLVGKISDIVSNLEKIPEPSDVQKRLIKASKNILNDLATLEEGSISGYKPISNQTLIDQVQSLRQIIDYDFAHGNTKNIFRPLINELESAVIQAAEFSGNEEAAQALIEAKSAYKAWVEAFDNDYVRPFRDNSNKDFSKLFKSSLDFDESNMIRSILNLSERGRELSSASTREIVEKNLSKYFENPSKIDSSEFDKSVRELEAVITPEQAKEVREKFRQSQKKLGFKAKEATKEESVAAKYTKKQPEDIQKMMNTRSGIKELKKDLSKTEAGKKLYNTLEKQKIRSILREGNIEKEFTGDDLYKFLNKEQNYELLSEFLGEEITEGMRQEAKSIGKSQVTRDKVSKKVKNAAALKSMIFLVSLI